MIYCISSAGETLLRISGKGHSCPTAFLCCPQDTRRVSTARLWKISWSAVSGYEKSIHRKTVEDFTWSARVTELLGIILGFKWLLCSLPARVLFGPSILNARVGRLLQWLRPVCSRLGAQLNYLLHQVMKYSEETQFTFLSLNIPL